MKNKKLFVAMTILLCTIMVTIIIVKIDIKKEELENANVIQLVNIGEYNFDNSTVMSIPDSLSGTGIKVSDTSGNIIPIESVTNISDNKKLTLIVTIYNSQEKENQIELLLFLDNMQVPYSINNEQSQYWNYSIDMPKNSYINIPIDIDLKNINAKKGLHDIWFVCEYFANSPTTFEERQPYFHTDYHLKISSGSDDCWYENMTDNTIKESADPKTISKFNEISRLNCNEASINPFTISTEANNKLNTELELYYRNDSIMYQTFIIFNGRAINLTEEADSVIWISEKDKISNIYFDLCFSNSEIEETNKIYAISFPISNNDGVVFTSERMNVEVN